MTDNEKTKHGLENEPLGNEDQKAEDGPKSFEDKRPADPGIPKGNHTDTDTSRNPTDWEKEPDE